MTPFRILFLAFIFFVTSGLAQTKKDLHFFSHYSPNTVYQQSLVQSATNHMKYTGSKEFRENIEKKALKIRVLLKPVQQRKQFMLLVHLIQIVFFH
jgi:hypothetical protein